MVREKFILFAFITIFLSACSKGQPVQKHQIYNGDTLTVVVELRSHTATVQGTNRITSYDAFQSAARRDGYRKVSIENPSFQEPGFRRIQRETWVK